MRKAIIGFQMFVSIFLFNSCSDNNNNPGTDSFDCWGTAFTNRWWISDDNSLSSMYFTDKGVLKISTKDTTIVISTGTWKCNGTNKLDYSYSSISGSLELVSLSNGVLKVKVSLNNNNVHTFNLSKVTNTQADKIKFNVSFNGGGNVGLMLVTKGMAETNEYTITATYSTGSSLFNFGIDIPLNAEEGKTYNITGNTNDEVSINAFQTTSSTTFFYNKNMTGSVKITTNNADVIAGTFTFQGANEGNTQTINVTSGEFYFNRD